MRRLAFALCVMVCGASVYGQQAGGHSAAVTASQPLFADYQPLAGNSDRLLEGTLPQMLDDTPAPSPAPSPSPEPAPAPQIYYVQKQQPAAVYTPSWKYDSGFAIGYSNIHFQHASNSAFYNSEGPYFDGNFAYPIPGYAAPVVGVGLTASGYFQNKDVFGFGTLYSSVGMFAIEARIAEPIPAKADSGIFLLPRLGGGLLISTYAIDQPGGFGTIFTHYHTGLGFDLRPSIELGYRWSQGAAFGVEASYMWAWGSFGSLGSIAQEWRVGPVFSWRF